MKTGLRRGGALIFAGLTAACGGGYEQPANLCEAEGAQCVSVPVRDLLAVDGDTFELRRLSASGSEQRVRLRLIGWDSPETGDAAGCADEDALGRKVEARARELFASGRTVSFFPEGPDQYGRLRAHVYLDGVHIGWLLWKDGLSKPLEEGGQADWCG